MQNDGNRSSLNYEHQPALQNIQHPSLTYDQQSIQNIQIDEYRPNDSLMSAQQSIKNELYIDLQFKLHNIQPLHIISNLFKISNTQHLHIINHQFKISNNQHLHIIKHQLKITNNQH